MLTAYRSGWLINFDGVAHYGLCVAEVNSTPVGGSSKAFRQI